MSRMRTPISSRKGIKISDETRRLYERRDKSLDKDAETRPLPPERWAHAMTREEFFRPVKKQTTVRIDADVLAWLRAQGSGHLTRINEILRERMVKETRRRR
ncbi:MAG: BrnA antitoxin family protein [Terriglobia bacterium]